MQGVAVRMSHLQQMRAQALIHYSCFLCTIQITEGLLLT